MNIKIALEFLTTTLDLCCGKTDPDFVNCVQEQQNKVSKALLERAKEICASEGVKPKLPHFVYICLISLCCILELN